MNTPTETPLANPNVGMDNFITSLKDAGMEQAVEAVKEPQSTEAIAPSEPAPKKEAASPTSAVPEPKKETPKEPGKEPETEEKKLEEKRWPRKAEEWSEYKRLEKAKLEAVQRERDQIKEETEKIKSELEHIRNTVPPELEALKKEKAELDEQLRLVAVQNHPKFKAYFDKKIGDQIELAKRIVGSDKSELIAGLLNAPDSPLKDKQLEELTETLTPLQQSRLGGVLNDLAQIQAEREGEIAKSKANYEQIQKENQEAAEKQRTEFSRLFDNTVKSATDPKDGNPAFQKRDGDEAWNTDVDRRIETAKTLLFGSPKPEIVSKAALAAVAYPVVLSQLNSSLQEIESLKSQIKELQSAAPKVEPAKTAETTMTGNTQAQRPKPGSTDPMSAVAGWMNIINQTGQE